MSRDIPASVKARLLSYAREREEEFERVLTRYAAERFLYRLGASPASERCLLKGAALLAVRLVDPYRATRDVDLLALRPADDESIRGLLDQVCTVPCPEDGLRFDLSSLSLEPIRAEEGYPGTRARLFAHLGRARIRVQVDIGFGDAVALAPQRVIVPSLLHFADRAHLAQHEGGVHAASLPPPLDPRPRDEAPAMAALAQRAPATPGARAANARRRVPHTATTKTS